MKGMRGYYVVTKTNWQGSQWTPVAGPFQSRREAEKEAKNWEYHYVGPFGLDIGSEVHAKVVSYTQLRRMGWTDEAILLAGS